MRNKLYNWAHIEHHSIEPDRRAQHPNAAVFGSGTWNMGERPRHFVAIHYVIWIGMTAQIKT
jgi:hypothetical protein